MRLRKSSPCALNHSSTSASTSNVTETFSGIRSRALAKNVSSNGGISDVSISSSVISLTLAQFVSEGFFKSRALMFQSLSQRDDANHIFTFTVDNNYDEILEKTDAYPATLA